MSWLCINCETVNFDAETKCIVCGDERYYTSSEMKLLLENHPEAKQLRDENKKLNTQNKWLQTRNKNLTQENKQFKEQIVHNQEQTSLEPQKETIDLASNAESMVQISTPEEQISPKHPIWTQRVAFWQVTTAIATLSAILIAIFKW